MRWLTLVVLCGCSREPPAKPDPVVTLPSVPVASVTTVEPARSYALVIEPGPPGVWKGSHGDVPTAIAGIWGAGRDVYAVGPRGLLRSGDGGARWQYDADVKGTAVWGTSPDDVYVGGDMVKRSSDHGATFHDTGRVPGVVMALGGTGSDVFAAGIGPFLAHSTDHGATWQPIQTGMTDGTFFTVQSVPPDLWVTGLRREPKPSSSLGYHTVPVLMRSPDGGSTWIKLTPPTPGMTDNEEIRGLCFTKSGTMFVAMSYSVYSSHDRGGTWALAAGVGAEVLGLACRGTEVVGVARNRNFFDSNDDGATFRRDGLDPVFHGPELIALQAVSFVGLRVFVGGEAYTKEPAGTLLRRTD